MVITRFVHFVWYKIGGLVKLSIELGWVANAVYVRDGGWFSLSNSYLPCLLEGFGDYKQSNNA
jgi:hypothetical protein